jgi:pyridoxamine 5'-phosphate oxidase
LELQRQVTFVGEAAKVSSGDSDAYFALRPREAQLGAWTSEQSSEIESRDILMHRFSEFESRFGDHVPRPPHWGGYRIVPHEVEFWQGRPNRLHDRFRYLQADDCWTRHRLSP